jgi:hypothetical protein
MENLSAASAYFPIQNVYKMTYGDENETFEPVNGYKKTLIEKTKILYSELTGASITELSHSLTSSRESKRWIFGVLDRKNNILKGHGRK